MDVITLQNIRVPTRIGIEAAERAVAQELLVTVELRDSVKQTAATDDLATGIDYAAVTAAVVAEGARERKTIERFAEDVAAMILREFKPEAVTVSVEKHPDLPLEATKVTIIRP